MLLVIAGLLLLAGLLIGWLAGRIATYRSTLGAPRPVDYFAAAFCAPVIFAALVALMSTR